MNGVLEKIIENSDPISELGRKLFDSAYKKAEETNVVPVEDETELLVLSELRRSEAANDYLIIDIDSWNIFPEIFRNQLTNWFYSSGIHIPLSTFERCMRVNYRLLDVNTTIFILNRMDGYRELFCYDCWSNGEVVLNKKDKDTYASVYRRFQVENNGSLKKLVER